MDATLSSVLVYERATSQETWFASYNGDQHQRAKLELMQKSPPI